MNDPSKAKKSRDRIANATALQDSKTTYLFCLEKIFHYMHNMEMFWCAIIQKFADSHGWSNMANWYRLYTDFSNGVLNKNWWSHIQCTCIITMCRLENIVKFYIIIVLNLLVIRHPFRTTVIIGLWSISKLNSNLHSLLQLEGGGHGGGPSGVHHWFSR